MSPTPPIVIKENRGGAVLLRRTTIKQWDDRFLLQLYKETGVDAEATLSSAELQRILLLEMEAGKNKSDQLVVGPGQEDAIDVAQRALNPNG